MLFIWILFVPTALQVAGPAANNAAAHGDATFPLRGATTYTVSSAAIEHGDLLVQNGTIAGIGLKLSAPKDVRIIQARGLHVCPGIIGSAAGIGAVRETSDTNELAT
jgi:imidazolonepropionase-like amidohydrolase